MPATTAQRRTHIAERPVCVVGNYCIDLIIRGLPSLPVWGQETVGTEHVQVSSGQAGYSSFAMARLGMPVAAIGCVGSDAHGKQIAEELALRGIDTTGIEVCAGKKTAITVAAVREDGERAFLSDLACQREADEQIMIRQHHLIESADMVCVFGLFNLPGYDLSRTADILSTVQHAGKTTVLDTGWDPDGWPHAKRTELARILHFVSFFFPNMDEARAITGEKAPDKAAAILLEMGVQTVVIKLGSEGSFAQSGSQHIRQTAFPIKVFDAVGAGDVYNAGFLCTHRLGWGLEDCMVFASATSALYIAHSEDRFPSFSDVYHLACRHHQLPEATGWL